jgi:LAGLIDADG DNA endonuclease family protein
MKLNFLLPLLVGGPDMAKQKGLLVRKYTYNPRIKFIEKRYYSTSRNVMDKNKENNNKTIFNPYLGGLFEGDGHIWFPKENAKKKHNPRFCITFGLKNEPLAKKLLDIIGYGFIRYKPKDNACVLVVSPVKGLKKIIECINGELRTPKIIQLHNLIDWINKNHSSNVTKLSLKKGNLDKDSWLAGFIDADGSFSIQHTKLENNAKKRKISCRLRIEQIMYEPVTKNSYFDVLIRIAEFLGCSLKTRKQISTGNEYFNLTASSRKSLSIIITYFTSFPLYSSKYLDYKDWEKAVILILDKNYYTEQGIAIIDILKNKMNLKRTYFNWDHLNNLC